MKPKRPTIPAEAWQVYLAFTDLFDYELDEIEQMTAEEIVEMFKSREYYDRACEDFKNEHPYPQYLHECELATPAMLYTANLSLANI